MLATVPAAMSFGIDGSTGKCDYGGAASPINLYYLADVPHNDECETTSFLHLENGIKTWDFKCRSAKASASLQVPLLLKRIFH